MAKFNFPAFQSFAPVSREMKEMWSSFGQTLGVLRTAFENGIVLKDNISHYQYVGNVEHGSTLTIQHPLKRMPGTVFVESGRVEMMVQKEVNSSSVSLLFKLLSTQAVPNFNYPGLTQKLYTDDAPFFAENEEVIVDGVRNRVVAIRGREIEFLYSFVSKPVHFVSLFSTKIKLTML